MKTYARAEFIKAVEKKEIKNGTEFKVKKGEEEIGEIAVVRTTIVYLDIDPIPEDLFINDDYTFTELEQEEE